MLTVRFATLALRCVVFIGLAACLAACASRARVNPVLTEMPANPSALAVSDALESLIAVGKDTPADRVYAYNLVLTNTSDTAGDTFARAAVTGRFVQQKGLLGASLVPDIERYAGRSRELDPHFRSGAATRLLGTLYVTAPATLLKHGNSEEGLELLEGLAEEYPDVPENQLRLAEAYIALNDPAPACPHLRLCLARKSALRPDDQALLNMLVAAASPLRCSEAPAAP